MEIIVGLIALAFLACTFNGFVCFCKEITIAYNLIKPTYILKYNGHKYMVLEKRLFFKKFPFDRKEDNFLTEKQDALHYIKMLKEQADIKYNKYKDVTIMEDTPLYKKLEGE